MSATLCFFFGFYSFGLRHGRATLFSVQHEEGRAVSSLSREPEVLTFLCCDEAPLHAEEGEVDATSASRLLGATFASF